MTVDVVSTALPGAAVLPLGSPTCSHRVVPSKRASIVRRIAIAIAIASSHLLASCVCLSCRQPVSQRGALLHTYAYFLFAPLRSEPKHTAQSRGATRCQTFSNRSNTCNGKERRSKKTTHTAVPPLCRGATRQRPIHTVRFCSSTQ